MINLKDKDSPEFKELNHFVYEGYYDEIDNWFQKHQISKKPNLERDLISRIINATYFFMFKSLSTNRQILDEERIKREVAILKNLKCENQVKLFGVTSIEDVSVEHFKVIKLTNKNKELLQKSSSVCSALTKLFNEENFNELNKIQELLDFSILEQKSDGVTFHYREQYSRGASYFKISEQVFSPKYDIVFNYTEGKQKYLEEKGIALPTLEESEHLHKLILKYISDNPTGWGHETVQKVNEAINNYKIQKNYLDLNKNLVNTNKNNKKPKI